MFSQQLLHVRWCHVQTWSDVVLRTSAISRTFTGSCTEVFLFCSPCWLRCATIETRGHYEGKFVNPHPKTFINRTHNSKKMRSRRTNKTSSTISSMSAKRKSRKRNDTKKGGQENRSTCSPWDNAGDPPGWRDHRDSSHINPIQKQHGANYADLQVECTQAHCQRPVHERSRLTTAKCCAISLHAVAPSRRKYLGLWVELFISISKSVFTHLRGSLSCAVHLMTKMNLQQSANGRGKQEKHNLPLSGELLERRLFSCGAANSIDLASVAEDHAVSVDACRSEWTQRSRQQGKVQPKCSLYQEHESCPDGFSESMHLDSIRTRCDTGKDFESQCDGYDPQYIWRITDVRLRRETVNVCPHVPSWNCGNWRRKTRQNPHAGVLRVLICCEVKARMVKANSRGLRCSGALEREALLGKDG